MNRSDNKGMSASRGFHRMLMLRLPLAFTLHVDAYVAQNLFSLPLLILNTIKESISQLL